MAKRTPGNRNWQWQPLKHGKGVTLYSNGNALVCGICGAVGVRVTGNSNGHMATCVGCGCGTAYCATPARAMLAYHRAMASLGQG